MKVKLQTLVDTQSLLEQLMADQKDMMLKLPHDEYMARYDNYRKMRDDAISTSYTLQSLLKTLLNQNVEVEHE